MSGTTGSGLAIPFAVFARSIGPRVTVLAASPRPGVAPRLQVDPGNPDEVYLRLLKIDHGRESHTESEWMALIDGYRNQPAHPSDPNFVR